MTSLRIEVHICHSRKQHVQLDRDWDEKKSSCVNTTLCVQGDDNIYIAFLKSVENLHEFFVVFVDNP
jgi:hypothetical protein